MSKPEEHRDIRHCCDLRYNRTIAQIGRPPDEIAAIAQLLAECRENPNDCHISDSNLPTEGGSRQHRWGVLWARPNESCERLNHQLTAKLQSRRCQDRNQNSICPRLRALKPGHRPPALANA